MSALTELQDPCPRRAGCAGAGSVCARQQQCRPQCVSGHGPGTHPGGSRGPRCSLSAAGAAAAALRSSGCDQGLLRRRGLSHHLRLPLLCGEKRHRARRLNCSCAAAPGRRRDHGQDPSASTGLRHHRARTASTATASSPAIRSCSPGARPAAALPACRRARQWPRSAPTPAAPSACRRRSAGWPATARPSASAAPRSGKAACIWLSRSTPLGWLFRDLRDGPVLAAALLDVPPGRGAARRNHRRRGQSLFCTTASRRCWRCTAAGRKNCAGPVLQIEALRARFLGGLAGDFRAASRDMRRPRCIAGTLSTLSGRSRNGWPGAHPSPPRRSRICASVMPHFAPRWIVCSSSMTFSYCPVLP